MEKKIEKLNYRQWYYSSYNSGKNLEFMSNRSVNAYNSWISRMLKNIKRIKLNNQQH